MANCDDSNNFKAESRDAWLDLGSNATTENLRLMSLLVEHDRVSVAGSHKTLALRGNTLH